MKKIIYYLLIAIIFPCAVLANDTKSLKLALNDFVAGATSGAAGMVVYSPFHYFQNRTIQKLPIEWGKPHYWFRGTPTLALGKAPTIAVQMSSYGLIIRIMKNNNPATDLSYQQKTAAATIAGGISGTINNFTHLIALHQENKGTSFAQTTKQLSPRDLTRGLGATVTREMLFTNIFLVLLKDMKEKIHARTDNATYAPLMSGLFLGGAAATTQPFMVITAKLYADMEKKTV